LDYIKFVWKWEDTINAEDNLLFSFLLKADIAGLSSSSGNAQMTECIEDQPKNWEGLLCPVIGIYVACIAEQLTKERLMKEMSGISIDPFVVRVLKSQAF